MAKNARAWLWCVVGSVVALASAPAYGIPTHPHGDDWTSWERDATGGARMDHDHTGVLPEPGDEAHQHYSGDDFNGDLNETEPWSAYGAWDDRTGYVDRDDPFGELAEFNARPVPHGYIRSGFEPRYKFDGDWTSSAAQSAMGLVEDAYDLWSSIHADKSPVTNKDLITGVGFEKVASGNAEILIKWENLAGVGNGGSTGGLADGTHTNANPITITFDNSLSWDFTKDGSVAADNDWHFFSVALHETGHTMFLEHQGDNDLMDPSVGEPLNNDADGDGGFWRWSGLTDNLGENDFFTGFSRVDGAWAAITDKDSVDGVKALYSIPIPEPGTLLLLGVGLVGLGAGGRRRR